MEFKFNVGKLVRPDATGFSVLDGSRGNPFSSTANAKNRSSMYFGNGTGPANMAAPIQESDQLAMIIDNMGAASSKAQQLPQTITTAMRFFGSDQRLYLKVDKSTNAVIGLLKVGERKLFIRSENGQIREITPLCVLDFYVHESVQRGGQGKQIFQEMLQRENNVHPAKLAYDRPSNKLIGFLSKHYGLKNYVSQNNNFIVFNQYWDPTPQKIQQPAYQPFVPAAQPEIQQPQVQAAAVADYQTVPVLARKNSLPKAARTVRFADQDDISSMQSQVNAQQPAQPYQATMNQVEPQHPQPMAERYAPPMAQKPPAPQHQAPSQSGLPPYQQMRRQNSYTRQTGVGGSMSGQGSPGISKQLSNAGLNVMGNGASTPTGKQMGKTTGIYPSADPHQKENAQTAYPPPSGGHLPPRHPKAQGGQNEPTFGSRVPRRDGNVVSNDSVMSLLGQTEGRRSGSRGGGPTSAALKNLDSKMAANEAAVNRRRQEVEKLESAHMRVSQSNQFASQPGAAMSSTSFARQSHATRDFQPAHVEAPKVDEAGPTSFASVYNKRQMHATVNDSFARVSQNAAANQEQVQRQKQMQMTGQMPWGSTGYNYDQGFQRKRF